jgi:hypothetical protein
MLSEAAARRGEARMRRVQSIETDDGVTILSNRFLDSPDPRRVARQALVRAQPPGEAVIDEPQSTETRSLRSVPATPATGDEGDTWPSWPLFLLPLMAAGVTSGVLWFRKKRRKGELA